MTLRLFCALILLPSFGFSQKLNKYWVELRDKNSSPYCTCRPAEFLSARALDRRARAGIDIVENDLPVSPAYIKALKDNGLKLHGVSRWLNAVIIIADTSAIKKVPSFPFVRRIEYLGPHLKFRNPPNRVDKKRTPVLDYPNPGGTDNPLGYTSLQNSLLNMPPLFAAGHRGDGIWVAVMDGGFTNVDTIPLFDSVALQGRLFPGWDFVERDAGLFESASHGTSVLSVMAGNLPGYFIGTAPDATYFLLKTEDTGGEFPIEEANWIAGAEWADSVGIDIINASLGYTSFNDTTLSHQYADLDGHTAIGSRGATIAATKGMIICNAAGNEGDGVWHYIGVPADAPGVIAVGAVGSDGARALFSSFGPSADGRIKPELVAPGDDVVVAGNVGTALGVSGGTSLASPMLAGALAALWSAFPEKTADEILQAVFQSADQYLYPDNERGWGLPDMTRAWLSLGAFSNGESTFAFDRLSGELVLLLPNHNFKNGDPVEIQDVYGNTVHGIRSSVSPNDISTIRIKGVADIAPGTYRLRMKNTTQTATFFVLSWP
jgi:serine protease AprX